MFLFIPWLQFISHAPTKLIDRMPLKIAIGSEDCKKILHTFNAKIANSTRSREFGLSHRQTPLNNNEAMLFIFEEEQIVTFWMKHTYIPLEIAYINKNGQILEWYEMPIEKDPENPKHYYSSQQKVLAALEMPPKKLTRLVKEKKLQICVNTLQ